MWYISNPSNPNHFLLIELHPSLFLDQNFLTFFNKLKKHVLKVMLECALCKTNLKSPIWIYSRLLTKKKLQ